MSQELITAVEAIKTAVFQSQYQASKEMACCGRQKN